MNARTARRLATRRLARAAKAFSAEADSNRDDGLSEGDRRRMADAYLALAHELDVRTGDAERKPRTPPVDPLQLMFFEQEGNAHDAQEELRG